jgi:hypothetical protein
MFVVVWSMDYGKTLLSSFYFRLAGHGHMIGSLYCTAVLFWTPKAEGSIALCFVMSGYEVNSIFVIIVCAKIVFTTTLLKIGGTSECLKI